MKRLLPPACALLCGACVTVNEPVLSPQSAAQGQKTVLAVYASPGPWVVTDTESKAESAAKTLPLLSSVVQGFQDERNRKEAEDLEKFLPPWRPAEEFAPMLLEQLSLTGFPGRFVPAAETQLGTAALRGFNRSSSVLDWQKTYFYEDPLLPQPRNYSRILSLDDALVFEANLLPEIVADDDGNMIPTLSVSSRLLRCRDMRLLWKHEDKIEDKAGARSLYEFKTLGRQLVDRWKALIPALAAKVAASLREALGSAAAAPATPAPEAPAVSVSSAAAASPAAPPPPSAAAPAPQSGAAVQLPPIPTPPQPPSP